MKASVSAGQTVSSEVGVLNTGYCISPCVLLTLSFMNIHAKLQPL